VKIAPKSIAVDARALRRRIAADRFIVIAIEAPPFFIDFASHRPLAEEIMAAILHLITGRVHGEQLNRYEAV
jgi:hypothetical protein